MTVAKLFRHFTGKASVVIEDRFVVVSAYRLDGVSADEGFALRDLINAHHPTEWQFFNPSLFIVLFRLVVPGARANAEALAAHLRGFGPSLALGVGVAEGDLTAEFSDDGRLVSWPLGSTMSTAADAAQSEAKFGAL